MNNPRLVSLFVFLALQACAVNYEDTVLQPVQNPPVSQADTQVVAGLPAQSAAEKMARSMKSEAELRHTVVAAPAYAAGDMSYLPSVYQDVSRENYQHYRDGGVVGTSQQPVSTFSIDVDTGSYANVRRFLQQGQRPIADAVRVEELINYFRYDDARPVNREIPFGITTELAITPWNPGTHLLRIGIRGYDIEKAQLPPANLVFLVDVSGSMQSPDKIELLKSGLKLLVNEMDKADRISLVVYAGQSGVVLEPTSGDEKYKINAAIDGLAAGGSTNGGAGIELAYNLAQRAFIKDGINRILLATDGDFNVGVTDFEQLKQLVEHKRQQGVSLTTLGFGTGNYNDQLMEQLADTGNGNYSYIDNLNEARKVLVGELQSTLMTIAKDVKIQIEFNPAIVHEYRQIGYENRMLQREDFNNDKVDAGEIGAGHSVTALYEISLQQDAHRMDNLRYGRSGSDTGTVQTGDEVAFIKFRYKLPSEASSRLISQVISLKQGVASLSHTSESFRFSAAVAAFGQHLRGGKYLAQYSLDDILGLARDARGRDDDGYRGEFLQLVQLAKAIH